MNAPTRSHPFEGRSNPFEDTIVREPREAPPSAAGLNDAALSALEQAFAVLEAAQQTKKPARPPKAKLVVSPDRGYGKTHLLGRLFAKLAGRASTIYLTPFQDPNKPWHSILRMTIDELVRPLAADACQLQALAISVLARLGADLLAAGEVAGYADADRAADYLRRLAANPGAKLTLKADWIAWLARRDTLDGLVQRLRHAHLPLDTRDKAWVQVLTIVAKEPRYSETWSAALKWMRAEALEPHDIERLPLDASDNDANGDASPWEVNDLCCRRLRGLCALASLHRPFVFCFDQTEFFVDDKALIHTFGRCVQQLVDGFPNHLTIVTANQSNWIVDLQPYIEAANLARISSELVSLEGVRRENAAEVLRARLSASGFDEAAVGAFFAGGWLDEQFAAVSEIGVRDLLTRADRRFRDLAKQPPPARVTLDALFDAELAKLRGNPALQSFNPDALLWFVKDMGPALAGVNVERLTNAKNFSAQWRWPDRRVCFAFEGGDHHKRWDALAQEVSTLAKSGNGAFAALALRTPDLPSIPRPTWRATTAAITTAQAQGFRIVVLPAGRLCEILAARELHSNALQGNIDFDGSQTLKWLREQLAPVLRELDEAAFAQPKTQPPPEPANKQPDDPDALLPDQERATLALVRESKIVDISAVLARIGGEARRDALLRFCASHPNLKAHEGPKSTMLQWRL